MTQITDIEQQLREQQEQARAARILLDERQKAQLAPEQALAQAQANIERLTKQRAETLFNEALEQNNHFLNENQDAIKRLHEAMAARPLSFDKVRALAHDVQATFERQRQHVRRSVDNMEKHAPVPTAHDMPSWVPLMAKFAPAIDAHEALIWFIQGKTDDALMEAQAIVYVFVGQLMQVTDSYDPVVVMRNKLSARIRP